MQVYSFLKTNIAKSYPIIFMNTSMVKSLIQRMKRGGDGKILWKEELSNDFPGLLKWYTKDEKAFKEFEKAVIKK